MEVVGIYLLSGVVLMGKPDSVPVRPDTIIKDVVMVFGFGGPNISLAPLVIKNSEIHLIETENAVFSFAPDGKLLKEYQNAITQIKAQKANVILPNNPIAN